MRRRQKKVLSLVLCVAMMLSVMVVGAGAAFSDQSKIKNTEAVDACTALNIIGGYPDGSFKPEGNITRAEVTKMICVALNGGKNPAVSTNTTPTFSDVRNNANAAWAEGYIESCAAQGIVSGVGGGKFAPNGNVTGVQLAKMLLVSLGYKSENEGFTGNAWATNVNVRAAQKGLYEGLEKMDSNAAITRDNAAQMVWNALQAYEVEYKTDLVADKDGKLSTQVTVSDKVDGNFKKITLLRDKYDAWTDVGTLTSVKSNVITLTMNSSDKAASDLVNDNGSVDFSKLSKDYSALIGQKVKVLFKNGKTNDVIGVYATSDNTIYKTLLNNVELDGQKIKFDGKSYSIDEATNKQGDVEKGTIKVITDGNTAVNTAIDPTFKDTADNKKSMNEVIFIDSDDNGKIDTAIITTKTPAKVTYVSSTDIVADGTTYKFADDNISKDLAKDDYAVITKNLYNDNNDIVKAEVLNTKLTGYRAKTGYVQYQLDGKWYNMAAADGDVTTGDTVKAYVYNGVVLDLDTDDGNGSYPSNVAVVVAKGNDGLNGDQAKIRYFDGTSPKTVTVDEDSVSLTVGNAYKVTTSGSDMKFEALKDNNKYNGFKFVGNKQEAQVAQDKIANTKVDDSAVIILYDGNGASKQITGKQYNALTSSDVVDGSYSAVFTKETNGLTRVRMASVKVPKTNVSGKSNDNYAYIISDGVENENGKTAITIWTGTENKNVVVDTGYTDGEYTKGMLIGYSTIDDKGIINDVDKIGDIDSATKFPESDVNVNTLYKGSNKADVAKYITVNDGQLNVTADTTVLLVNSDADNDNEIGLKYTYGDKLPKASEYGNKYLINAMWVMDEAGTDDADIEVLVIDATGAFKGYKMDDVNAPSLKAGAISGTATYGSQASLTVALTSANVDMTKAENKTVTTGTLPTGITVSTNNLTANGTAATQTITVANNVKVGTYTVTFKAAGKSVDVKVEVKAAKVANLNATVTGNDVINANGQVVSGKTLADVKAAITASNAAGIKATSKVVSVSGRDVAESYAPVAGEKVVVTITYTANEGYDFTGAKAAAIHTINGKVSADTTSATVVYTFVVA